MNAAPQPALAIAGLAKNFGRAPVLADIALTLAPGRFMVLAGESGSGKTTLLRIVGGLERADRGSVAIHGMAVDGPGGFLPPERRGLGMVFQEFALWPHLTCFENVAIAVPRGTPEPRKLAAELLERMGVAAHADRRPAALSGGQQQRVGIARALAARPRLLLLDEPLSSLDLETREMLRMELRLAVHERGVAALLVSHDPADCWHLADQVAVLEAGRIIQSGSPAEIWHAPRSSYVARFTGALGGIALVLERQGDAAALRLGAHCLAVPANGQPAGPVRVFWRDDAIRAQPMPDDTLPTIPAEPLASLFEAGRYRVLWRITGCPAPLISYEPAPPQGPCLLRLDGDKFLILDPKDRSTR